MQACDQTNAAPPFACAFGANEKPPAFGDGKPQPTCTCALGASVKDLSTGALGNGESTTAKKYPNNCEKGSGEAPGSRRRSGRRDHAEDKFMVAEAKDEQKEERVAAGDSNPRLTLFKQPESTSPPGELPLVRVFYAI